MDQLDVDKLITVPVGFKKLSGIADKDVAKMMNLIDYIKI